MSLVADGVRSVRVASGVLRLPMSSWVFLKLVFFMDFRPPMLIMSAFSGSRLQSGALRLLVIPLTELHYFSMVSFI